MQSKEPKNEKLAGSVCDEIEALEDETKRREKLPGFPRFDDWKPVGSEASE